MLVNSIETKTLFESLKEYEGYIQLSGENIKIFNSSLTWEELHKDKNFIIEAHFYNKNTNEVATIRQINGDYKTFKKQLNSDDLKDCNTYKSNYGDIKIAQIWEAKPDENCIGLSVLKPTIQLFVGFENLKGDKDDNCTI